MLKEYLNNPIRRAIETRLRLAFDGSEPLSDDAEFNQLALHIFEYQFARCAPFRKLCESEGIRAAKEVSSYLEIPCVPTEAFKFYRLVCFPPTSQETVFHTSGTTQGMPGRHFMPNTELYDAAALPAFARAMLEPRRRYRFLSLTGSPSTMPHSSLVHMIDAAGRRFSESGEVEYFFENGALSVTALRSAIEKAERDGVSVLLLTTAFALVQCLEAVDSLGKSLPLPEGSRIMETGGYKGRSRVLPRADLYARTSRTFGIPEPAIINEYGMTEMSSQFYDKGSPSSGAFETRIKIPPNWVRAEAVAPLTLKPVLDGEYGLLRIIDLANIDSCAFLMTADMARKMGQGFELMGRIDDIEPRGCSLDYEPFALTSTSASAR